MTPTYRAVKNPTLRHTWHIMLGRKLIFVVSKSPLTTARDVLKAWNEAGCPGLPIK